MKRLEKELGAFVADSRRTAHSLAAGCGAPSGEDARRLRVYGVGTRSYDRSPERHIRILREPGAPAPAHRTCSLSEAAALPVVSVLPEPAPGASGGPAPPPKPPARRRGRRRTTSTSTTARTRRRRRSSGPTRPGRHGRRLPPCHGFSHGLRGGPAERRSRRDRRGGAAPRGRRWLLGVTCGDTS